MSVDLILDVDGVLNAYPPMAHRPKDHVIDWGWECEPSLVECYGYPITYAPALVERINTLAAREDVHGHWLTTWLDEAPRHICPGLGVAGADWPVLGVRERNDRSVTGWWKYPALVGHVSQRLAENPDHRFVWIDDDLAFDHEAQTWVAVMNLAQPIILGIAPKTETGLTLAHLDIIEHWIETGEVAA